MAMLIALIKILLIIAGVEQNPGPIVAPNIKTGIEDQTVILGEPWEYKLHISGDSPFNVKVTKDTIDLPATGHVEYSCDNDVVRISIKDVEVTDEGSYQIEVSNGSEVTASCTFKITVHQYNFRYQYLLVETDTKVLRRLLDSKIGHDLDNYLRMNPSHSTTLQTLINGKKGVRPAISAKQAELLPPKDNNPKSEKFDITLLTCLLRNICNLKPPSHSVWQNKPSVTDLSEEAYIMRLKNCRNNLSHSGTVRFPATEFAEKWKELSETLLALNKFCGKDYIVDLTHTIDSVKGMVIDETARELLTEIIKNWNATENDLKEDIERVEEIATTNLQEIRAVKRKLDDIAGTGVSNKNMKFGTFYSSKAVAN